MTHSDRKTRFVSAIPPGIPCELIPVWPYDRDFPTVQPYRLQDSHGWQYWPDYDDVLIRSLHDQIADLQQRAPEADDAAGSVQAKLRRARQLIDAAMGDLG